MKVCTDGCLFGGWMAERVVSCEMPVDSILDIGTGTGLLSLMLAQKTNAIIDAIEIDEGAAVQATDNMDVSPWKERLQVICGDARTVHLGKKYGLIISNPPFFEHDLKSTDEKRNLALHGDALSFEELLTAVTKHLEADGKFAVLLPYLRKDEFIILALAKGFFAEEVVLVKQTPPHDFFRAMILFGKVDTVVKQSTLIIHEDDQYSEGFTALLKEYYLKL